MDVDQQKEAFSGILFDKEQFKWKCHSSAKRSLHMAQQDLRIQKTKRSLLAAFFKLAETQDFDQITIDQLCKTALIRRNTFYRHFEDKYSFVDYVIEKSLNDIYSKHIQDYPDLSTEDYYYQVVHESLAFIDNHKRFISTMFNSRFNDLLSSQVSNRIMVVVDREVEKYKALGRHFPKNTRFTTRFFTGGILSILYQWIMSDFAMSVDELSREITQLILAFWRALSVEV